MEFSSKKLKQLTSTDLLPAINKFVQKYQFLELSDDELNVVETEVVQNFITTYRDGDFNLTDLKDRIEKRFSDIIQIKLQDSKNSFLLANNFIHYHFKQSNDYEQALLSLKQLSHFFTKYDFKLELDFIIELIHQNVVFLDLLKLVVKENLDFIKNDELASQFTDNNIILFIDSYCMIYDVGILEKEEQMKDENTFSVDTIDDSDTIDLVKMYLNEIQKFPILTKKQEQELMLKIIDGDVCAKEMLVESNLKLVTSIAIRYIDKGLSFLDLLQEGNIGLLIAIDRYDVTKGYKFSTYATFWIKKTIIEALKKTGRTIRLSNYMQHKISLFQKTKQNLEFKLNKEPTLNEIALEMGVSLAEIVKLYHFQFDASNIEQWEKESRQDCFHPYASSSFENNLEDHYILEEMQKEIRELLDSNYLTENDTKVLILRYGLLDGEYRTLEKVGDILGVTKAAVRRAEQRALTKIRSFEKTKQLACYLDYPDEALINLEQYRKKYPSKKNKNSI